MNNTLNPAEEELELLHRDISEGRFKEATQKIEAFNIDVNVPLRKYTSMLNTCIFDMDYSEGEHVPLIKYLLAKGANPNLLSRDGFNPFHILIIRRRYDLIEFFLDNGAEVNKKDNRGNTAFFLFLNNCYDHSALRGVSLKMRCINIIEKFLEKGTDADDFDGRTSFLPEMQTVLTVIEKYNALGIEKEIPWEYELVTDLKYPDLYDEIWKKYVPESGEADTVQGELLRAVEKLRYEALQNGNMN